MTAEVEIAVLTAAFDAREGSEAQLDAALARYVVLTRREPECRNVDLLASITRPGRIVLIEKWTSTAAAQDHLDSELMAGMATEVLPLLAGRPELDLLDTVSAHDLA